MAADEQKAIGEIKGKLKEIDPAGFRAVVGFDGFIDEIIHPVAKREGVGSYEPIRTIAEFAERVAGAAGKSANIEMVPVKVKLGGNGPIMAEALVRLGAGVTYIGCLGRPRIHPVFQEFARICDVISLEEPAHTDALEFHDGKLMLGKMIVFEELDWRRLSEAAPVKKMAELVGAARLLAMVNWTMLPWMTDIWRRLLDEVCPKLPAGERLAFFDLADPQKRTKEDLAEALETIKRFSDYFDVVLGLNEREAQQVASLLAGGDRSGDTAEANTEAIAGRMGIYAIVVHPTDRAMTVIDGKLRVQKGSFTNDPLITTGAGDHFNAGFCTGQLAGLSPRASLLAGVGCSGYYVRTGESPGIESLARFIETGKI